MNDKPFRRGRIHVMRAMCPTCIFRPGNLMRLKPGRIEFMVAAATRRESCIPCHETLDGAQAVCHGFFRLHATVPLRLAAVMNAIEYQEPRE